MVSLNFDLQSEVREDATLDELKKVLFFSMQKMKELAIQNSSKSVDTARLKNSINLFPEFPGSTEYFLTDGIKYGQYVEFGTSPHFPPVDSLKDWARRKLGDEDAAYPVALKISKQGTPPQPFMRPALNEVKRKWVGFYVNKFLSSNR